MQTLTHVYRFRSIERLLGESRELDNLEIYLSSADRLNDPMEGFQDVFWKGDAVLWENLLRHYLLSLLWNTAGCVIMDDASFEEPAIVAKLTEDDLPTDAFRAVYRDACNRFFSSAGLRALSAQLACSPRPLRMEGLRFLLSLVHLPAFFAVTASLREAHLLPQSWPSLPAPDIATALGKFSTALKADTNEVTDADLEAIAFAANHVREQQALRQIFGLKEETPSVATRKKDYLLVSFPDRYAKGISESLIHPEWQVACFSGDCTNASMWSTYADQHRGAALMFRVHQDEGGRPFLDLFGVTGFSASRADPTPRPRTGKVRGILYGVNYEAKAPEVDFFRFIGTLPRPKLRKAWHSNRSGELSPVVEQIFEDETSWRKELWESFYRMSTTKLPDWQHEKEYRLVFPDLLGTRREHRKITYDVSVLAGVVFGLRTSTADKLRIIRLLDEKCRAAGHKEFAFYQMSYWGRDGRLVRL